MRAVATAAVVVALAACGDATTRVEGRIVEFDGDLTAVRSFVLLTERGDRIEFRPGPEATFHGGPLTHLRDHLVSGEPVVVFYEGSADEARVVSVEDA